MRPLLLLALLVVGGCPREDAAPATTSEVSHLASDEEVMLVPTFATRTAEGWSLPVQGWVFEPEDDSLVRAGLLEAIEEALELEFDEATAERVTTKLGPFMVDNEGGKTLVIRADEVTAEVCTSTSDGRCSGVLLLPSRPAGTLALSVVLRESDDRRFEGRVQLLEDEGVSVLSDIDDTIRITEVDDRKKLIENTFARPFQATPGVVGLYQRWAKQGAAFHYVSNSPLPLLGAIEAFIDEAGYPRGSITLKAFRWKDGSFLDLLAAPEDHKQLAIEGHLDRFAKRRFVLVGDTTERDPEIYAALRRKYGDRIVKIYLRDTGSMQPDALEARLDAVFEGLPAELWTVFVDAAAVTDPLP